VKNFKRTPLEIHLFAHIYQTAYDSALADQFACCAVVQYASGLPDFINVPMSIIG
jgi:hypothetical protein